MIQHMRLVNPSQLRQGGRVLVVTGPYQRYGKVVEGPTLVGERLTAVFVFSSLVSGSEYQETVDVTSCLSDGQGEIFLI